MPTLIATTFSDQTNQPLVWLCSSCEAAVREGVEKLSASSSSGSRSWLRSSRRRPSGRLRNITRSIWRNAARSPATS